MVDPKKFMAFEFDASFEPNINKIFLGIHFFTFGPPWGSGSHNKGKIPKAIRKDDSLSLTQKKMECIVLTACDTDLPVYVCLSLSGRVLSNAKGENFMKLHLNISGLGPLKKLNCSAEAGSDISYFLVLLWKSENLLWRVDLEFS